MRLKKRIVMLVGIALILSLAACGSSGHTASETTAEPAQQETGTEPTAQETTAEPDTIAEPAAQETAAEPNKTVEPTEQKTSTKPDKTESQEAQESAEEPETTAEPAQQETAAEPDEPKDPDETINDTEEYMRLFIGSTEVSVTWEDNESVKALIDLVKTEALTINMSMYGGFEQVGSLGASLPRNDVQTATEAGDIVLYSGNQIVIFYGSNSWAYTRLGRITDKTAVEMADLLGSGNVVITISL